MLRLTSPVLAVGFSPAMVAKLNFTSRQKNPDRFLACVTYSDESQTFAQAFLLALQKRRENVSVIEEAEPKGDRRASVCYS